MPMNGMERVARALAFGGNRRQVVLAALLAIVSFEPDPGDSARSRPGSSILDKRRRRAERRTRRSQNKGKKNGKGSPGKRCRRFVISAGPNPTDRFRHIDDDLLIELYPGGTKKGAEIILNDDNNSPNGPGGSHPKPPPFKARVGDRIHIVARNEVGGGCELDEIWLHCTESGGGKQKLADAISPEECSGKANQIGAFFETTVRIE